MDADESDELLDIDDLCVPDIVRQHGLRFRKPARFVIDLGGGEYLLFAQDGELLDAVYLK